MTAPVDVLAGPTLLLEARLRAERADRILAELSDLAGKTQEAMAEFNEEVHAYLARVQGGRA